MNYIGQRFPLFCLVCFDALVTVNSSMHKNWVINHVVRLTAALGLRLEYCMLWAHHHWIWETKIGLKQMMRVFTKILTLTMAGTVVIVNDNVGLGLVVLIQGDLYNSDIQEQYSLSLWLYNDNKIDDEYLLEVVWYAIILKMRMWICKITMFSTITLIFRFLKKWIP